MRTNGRLMPARSQHVGMPASGFVAVRPPGARLVFALGVVALSLGLAEPLKASTCAAGIDQVQQQVDAAIGLEARTGDTARESTVATMHRQPTPASMQKAENELGEGSATARAAAALTTARAADQTGDPKACQEALAEARRTLGGS